jgi:hypothetical protein
VKCLAFVSRTLLGILMLLSIPSSLSCASLRPPSPPSLDQRTLRLSLIKIGFAEYEYDVCDKLVLGICFKKHKQVDYYNLSDPAVVKDFVARGFVLKVRDSF